MEDISTIISRMLASEQRAKGAEERATQAKQAARQHKCESEVDRMLLYEIKKVASAARYICEENRTNGSRMRPENWHCANGERAITNLHCCITNLMVDILFIEFEDSGDSEG